MKTQAAFSELFKYTKGRLKVIDALHDKRKANECDNWQDQKTPLDICEKMVGMVPNGDLTWVVLFSLEFLEILVDRLGVLSENILFVADCTQESKAAEQMYGVKSCLFTKEMYINDRNKLDKFITMVKERYMKMEFTKLAVIGNPPYQMMNNVNTATKRDGGGDGAKPIYHLFIEACIDHLSPDYLSMIVPSRWMAGGQGLDKFRERMMNDRRMRIIKDFKGTFDVFPSVQIAGGVNYFLWDKEYDGPCDFNGVCRNLNEYDIIIRDHEAIGIIEKVTRTSNKFVCDLVSSQKPYGIPGNSVPSESGTICYFKQSIGKSFTNHTISDKRNDLDKWRVLIPYILHPPDDNKPFMAFNRDRLNIAEPGSVCSESFLVVGRFDSEEEANNFISYFGTKFFRFLLRVRICSLHASRSVYRFVPDLQDYSKPWSDSELYNMFALNSKEIDYIESKIKEFK